MSGGRRKLAAAQKNLKVFSFEMKALGLYLHNLTYIFVQETCYNLRALGALCGEGGCNKGHRKGK